MASPIHWHRTCIGERPKAYLGSCLHVSSVPVIDTTPGAKHQVCGAEDDAKERHREGTHVVLTGGDFFAVLFVHSIDNVPHLVTTCVLPSRDVPTAVSLCASSSLNGANETGIIIVASRAHLYIYQYSCNDIEFHTELRRRYKNYVDIKQISITCRGEDETPLGPGKGGGDRYRYLIALAGANGVDTLYYTSTAPVSSEPTTATVATSQAHPCDRNDQREGGTGIASEAKGKGTQGARLDDVSSGTSVTFPPFEDSFFETLPITALSISPDGAWLAVAALDGNFGIQHLPSADDSQRISMYTDQNESIQIVSVVFSPNSRYVALGGWDGALYLYRRSTSVTPSSPSSSPAAASSSSHAAVDEYEYTESPWQVHIPDLPITLTPGSDRQPLGDYAGLLCAWAPNSRFLAFPSPHASTGTSSICVMSIDSGDIVYQCCIPGRDIKGLVTCSSGGPVLCAYTHPGDMLCLPWPSECATGRTEIGMERTENADGVGGRTVVLMYGDDDDDDAALSLTYPALQPPVFLGRGNRPTRACFTYTRPLPDGEEQCCPASLPLSIPCTTLRTLTATSIQELGHPFNPRVRPCQDYMDIRAGNGENGTELWSAQSPLLLAKSLHEIYLAYDITLFVTTTTDVTTTDVTTTDVVDGDGGNGLCGQGWRTVPLPRDFGCLLALVAPTVPNAHQVLWAVTEKGTVLLLDPRRNSSCPGHVLASTTITLLGDRISQYLQGHSPGAVIRLLADRGRGDRFYIIHSQRRNIDSAATTTITATVDDNHCSDNANGDDGDDDDDDEKDAGHDTITVDVQAWCIIATSPSHENVDTTITLCVSLHPVTTSYQQWIQRGWARDMPWGVHDSSVQFRHPTQGWTTLFDLPEPPL